MEDRLSNGSTVKTVVRFDAGDAKGKEHETVVSHDETTLPALEHQ